MTTVAALTSGDEVALAGGHSAVFVAQTQHPLWPHLRLVVWRLPDGTWSHDALSALQDVGDVSPATQQARVARLRSALIPGQRTP